MYLREVPKFRNNGLYNHIVLIVSSKAFISLASAVMFFAT
jgi:hypothetical protein